MKIIYLTYNYDPCSDKGGDISTSLFIRYLVDIFGRENMNLVNLNNNSQDVECDCISGLNKSINIFEIYGNKKFYNSLIKKFSKKTSKGQVFKTSQITDVVKSIITQNTLNKAKTEVKVIFNSIYAMEFFSDIKYLLNYEGVQKVEFIYIADNIKHSHYSSSSSKEDRIEKDKILNIEQKLYDLDKVICFSKKDQDYFQSLNKKIMTSKIVYPLFYPKDEINKPIIEEKTVLISNHIVSDAGLISLKWFLDKVHPSIEKSINIVVTGKGDFRNFRKRYINSNIKFAGYLEKSVLNSLYKTCSLVFITKMIGSGISLNILEAMSYDCTIISTDYGNVFSPYVVSSDDGEKLSDMINKFIQFGIIDNERLDYNFFFKSNYKRLEEYLLS